jgi:hypothetical protein
VVETCLFHEAIKGVFYPLSRHLIERTDRTDLEADPLGLGVFRSQLGPSRPDADSSHDLTRNLALSSGQVAVYAALGRQDIALL